MQKYVSQGAVEEGFFFFSFFLKEHIKMFNSWFLWQQKLKMMIYEIFFLLFYLEVDYNFLNQASL